MKAIDVWLTEYSESHRNPRNKLLHRICVPLIVLSLLGLLRALPFGGVVVNACTLVMGLALLYYAALSWRLALGMAALMMMVCALIEIGRHGFGRWFVSTMIAVFVAAWVGQFIGHEIEGARPSFFKDFQFLLIGPLWLLADLYRRLGLNAGSRGVRSQP